jgi:hypothetical protein
MRSLLLTLTLFIPSIVFAQKVKLISGSLDVLKGQAQILLQFSYEDLLIGTDTPERDYLQRKKNEWDLKESGAGAAFEKYWYDSRKNYYELMFSHHFSKSSGLSVARTLAQYTIVVHTKRIEPGWNAGLVYKGAIVEGEAWLVASDRVYAPLAKITFEKCTGDQIPGGDFEMGIRIQSAYHVAAQEIGKLVKKKLR